MKLILISLLFYFSIISFSIAQEKVSGPIIPDFGTVYEVDNVDFKLDIHQEFKAVFDVMDTPEGHKKRNAYIETAARFLNMHVQAGMPLEQLKVAIVVHNLAVKDLLSNEAYRKRYNIDNPNLNLITALLDAGGQIIICGQSAISREISKEELIDGVQLSLSAMTALVQLQNNDYRLIKF
tara:strand:+ start:7097 stop:7636 length:540 start_codon:yes stop_codon:yes gene_type:complete